MYAATVVQVTQSRFRRLPALGRFTQLKTRLKKFPWPSQVPNQNLRQIDPGFLSYDLTKQTNRHTEITTLYV